MGYPPRDAILVSVEKAVHAFFQSDLLQLDTTVTFTENAERLTSRLTEYMRQFESKGVPFYHVTTNADSRGFVTSLLILPASKDPTASKYPSDFVRFTIHSNLDLTEFKVALHQRASQ